MSIRAKVYGGANAAEEPILKTKQPKGAKAESLKSVPLTRHARRASNGRGEDRHRLSGECARASWKTSTIDVELLNLSGGGAMVAGEFEPKLWDRVDLHLGTDGMIECAVRWIRDGRIGLEFAHETRLDWPSDEVATVLRHVIERSFPHIAFKMSEDEPEPEVERLSGDDEHRVAKRHPLIWNGQLHHDYQTDDIRIRNISATGAMIETSARVRVGAEPLLELGETVQMAATVEWAVGDQVGLRFHRPFEMNQLIGSRPSVATSNWTPPAYLDIDGRNDEDRWGRLTVSELQRQLEGFLRH